MLTPAAYAVVTICARRSLRMISGSLYVGAVAGGKTTPAEPKTRLPHGVRSQAFAASENRIICAALRFITSSLENASQSSFDRMTSVTTPSLLLLWSPRSASLSAFCTSKRCFQIHPRYTMCHGGTVGTGKSKTQTHAFEFASCFLHKDRASQERKRQT